MLMQHRDCGGEVVESDAIPPYISEEYGRVAAYECRKCNTEILGDAQIEFVPESEADRLQIEAMYPQENYSCQ